MRKPDLSKLHLSGGPSLPTMIVPPGTQIQVDPQGQVSIRTPGNLVLQNSGAYATLESVSGSIRIEPTVHVEAVTVRCADTCLVQGSLTAWRVVARTLHVDSDGEAHVVMQETEKLEVGKNGRLVGNFRSEKELFDLFSRFAPNVRALPPFTAEAPVTPMSVDAEVRPAGAAAGNGHDAAAAQPFTLGEELGDDDEPLITEEGGGTRAAAERGVAPAELPDALELALLLLEQESAVGTTAASGRRSLAELLRLLREGDVETLRHTYKTLFARLAGGGEGVKRARKAVGAFFDAEVESRA
ncbi:MAG TPA: hypothetical protein VGS57_02310 [Thermoanaerobaculia bacterium]|jgi:hypothetical protein|nr:hypothetical protein [Thermoanaerobaculia bacterium]